MSTPPITGWVPKVSAEPKPDEVHRLLTLAFQKLANHTSGFALLTQKLNAIKPGSTTTIEEGGVGGGGSIVPFTPSAAISVNNQSGVTSYSTVSGDDGALVVLSDASAIAVTLMSQSPPWSCFISNAGALGSGTVTLTPQTGTINGAATLTVLPTYGVIVCFDGTNWWAFTMPVVPVGNAGTTHEWVASYNAATGVFTLSQPAFSDISGTATTAQIGTGSPLAGEYVDGGTGAWTALPAPVLSGTTGAMGGAAMTVGQTITATATVTGATTSMAVACSPVTNPGAGFVWDAYVSAAGTVTACLTCILAGTPASSAYNVRAIK